MADWLSFANMDRLLVACALIEDGCAVAPCRCKG